MRTLGFAIAIFLLVPGGWSAKGATNLVEALSAAANHYEWVKLSREIDRQAITIAKTNVAAFVRHGLVQLSTTHTTATGNVIRAEIVALGSRAIPTLIDAITYAALPAPIFSDSTVANIPIFSMQLLGKMKSQDAVPALIDFIDKFETDVIIPARDGQPQNLVSTALTEITGQNFGKDKNRWMRWYEARRGSGE